MKKYLMTGIAALTLGGMITSCSHDMDQYVGNATENVKKTYENAFVQTFGNPAPTQNWGFGPTTAGSRGLTRTIQPSFDFPEDADASKFLADVPEGVEKLSQNVARANNWIDETWTGDINIWGQGTAENGWVAEGGTLYIKGNCDFSNRNFYFAGNSELYLIEGATLTLGENNGSGNLQQNTNIYIAEGANLIAKGELKLNNGLHIFNHGTIEAPKLSTNNNSWLVNGGTVKIAGKISVENTESVIENNGTITATDLNTAGSGKFENNADVTISGTTFVNSNSNTWVNNGQYHTGYFLYTAGSDEVINNCKLIVDEDFTINLGDNPGNGNFKMDAGSSVVTKNFNGGGNWTGNVGNTYINAQGGPFYIYMGANSVFKVTETATMNATKADYGIYGPADGGYAVFQAKNIVMGKENQGFEVTYGNNLYVYASESHFANGNDGQADHPYIDFKGNAKIYAPGFEDGLPSITINETPCNPGFTGNGGGEDEIETIRVIAEDLTINDYSKDFDFNDAVFDVNWNKTQNKVSVKVLAAGGELTMYIGGTAAGVDGVRTVNDYFAAANPNAGITAKTMINTAEGQHNQYNTFEYDLDSSEWSGTTIGEIAKSIYIRVMKSGELITLTADQGKAASKIAVGTDYEWCNERQDIDEKFGGKFSEYVGGAHSWNTWYK